MSRLICFSLLVAALLTQSLVSGQLLLNRGNVDAKNALNAALLDMWTDNSYNDLHVEWFSVPPERFADCVEHPAALSYPTSYHPNGLLGYMLQTSSIRMAYFKPLANPPSFELDEQGEIVGGFYPELAAELVSRISNHYQLLHPIQIEWVPITAVANFYPDHVAGVYDVIFMSLFKTAMWSAPVAPRNVIWNFSCGLLTTEPLRYYVCPSAVSKDLDLSSSTTLDGPNTIVQYIGGGAQEAAAVAAFPNSQLSAAANLSVLFANCNDGNADVIVELPNRITNSVSGIVVTSAPLGTFNNTGAAFRLDLEDDVCESESTTSTPPSPPSPDSASTSSSDE